MTTRLLVEIDFIKEPESLKKIMWAVENAAYGRSTSTGEKVSDARVFLWDNDELKLVPRLDV